MSKRDPLLAKIHMAKKDLGLDDTAYRAILVRVTGKDSSGNMSERQKLSAISEFKRLGWKPKPPKNKSISNGKYRPTSNKAWVRLMYGLAKKLELAGYWRLDYRDALRAFVKKETGIDNPEWLSFEQASPVIETLKSIERRVQK